MSSSAYRPDSTRQIALRTDYADMPIDIAASGTDAPDACSSHSFASFHACMPSGGGSLIDARMARAHRLAMLSDRCRRKTSAPSSRKTISADNLRPIGYRLP